MKLTVNKLQFIRGAYRDFRYPSVIAEIQLDNPDQLVWKNCDITAPFKELTAPLTQLAGVSKHKQPTEAALNAIISATLAVLKHFGYPRECEPITHNPRVRPDQMQVSIQLSCLSSEAFMAAIKLSWRAFSHLQDTGQLISLEAKESRMLVKTLKEQAPQGFNTRFMLEEAMHRGVPWTRIFGNYFQFGHGRKARLFDSSLSGSTPLIGATIAGHKYISQSLLHDAGFPVLPMRIVHKAEQAVAAARKLGMPVVIKPIATEGGRGVFALLDTEQSVTRAFNQVSKLSSQVLVEPFFEGRDYRVHVVHDSVHGLIERQPASVTGDGKHTVQELIEIKNHQRANATDDRQYLHAIAINQETERVLTHQRFKLTDIPELNQWVRLSSICNVATGGEPIQLQVDDMHADNAQLCIDAAKLLRLDIAGIDILIPDIGISWKVSGAHICEINHKPQMFTSFFSPLFDAFFGNANGRIPIILIIEKDAQLPVSQNLVADLTQRFDNVCWVTSRKREVGKNAKGASDQILESARHALLDTSVDALVVSFNDAITLDHGWPFSYCDELIVVADNIEIEKKIKQSSMYKEICESIKPRQIHTVKKPYI